MLFLGLFLANFDNFLIFWPLNAVKKNEIKKDMMKWTKEIKKKYEKNRAKKKMTKYKESLS